MSRPIPERADYPDLEVGNPKRAAVGAEAVVRSLESTVAPPSDRRAPPGCLLAVNQKDGFDCPSCAWPDPPDRKTAEFCENGAKAVGWEADSPLRTGLLRRTPDLRPPHTRRVLARAAGPAHPPAVQGRRRRPLPPGQLGPGLRDRRPRLAVDGVSDRAVFYTSGRTSNETAFAYQLFARVLGTNNLPDCSNMCHESTSMALAQTIGIGKASVTYEDFAKADLIVIMGQNPGTNHPRMLTALEEAKRGGTSIIAVNPLPEAGLLRFKNPQRRNGVASAREPSSPTPSIRSGSAAIWRCCRPPVAGCWTPTPSGRAPSSTGRSSRTTPPAWPTSVSTSRRWTRPRSPPPRGRRGRRGRPRAAVPERGAGHLPWAMGLTQHAAAVATIREIVNLRGVRGNIGRPGAGLAPIRGHSNVQGDRTMGIWERMPEPFLDAIGREFGFRSRASDGLDVVDTPSRRCATAASSVFIALGGNFVGAISDTLAAEDAMRGARLTVQISTKLNRSHVATGRGGAASCPRSAAPRSTCSRRPAVRRRSRTACAPCTPPRRGAADRRRRAQRGRDRRGRHRPGDARRRREHRLGGHDARLRRDPRPHQPRRARVRAVQRRRTARRAGSCCPTAPATRGRGPPRAAAAHLTVNELEHIECPPGRLILQTLRSHDQFNTTVYSLDDRYRGVRKGA